MPALDFCGLFSKMRLFQLWNRVRHQEGIRAFSDAFCSEKSLGGTRKSFLYSLEG